MLRTGIGREGGRSNSYVGNMLDHALSYMSILLRHSLIRNLIADA
jgi:hypothetical protein